GEPAPRQVHAQFFHQLALASDAIQVADQQNAQQKLGVNGWTAGIAVTRFQLLPHEGKANVLLDETQQMSFRNLIFQAEVIEQWLRTSVLPHHDQQASDDQNQTEHVRMLSSTMLLPDLIPLIDVTFSTPTGFFINYRVYGAPQPLQAAPLFPCDKIGPQEFDGKDCALTWA